MSWLVSLVVAFLTGVVGMLVGGFVANLAVSWYRISSFEGGAGYFVVGMALLGFVAGGVVGLVTARQMAPADPSFLRVLGTSVGIVVAIGGAIGGVSRAVADVEPTIDGAGLYLAFELRWPANEARAPHDFAGVGFARLGAGTMGNVIRESRSGALFVDDARQEDGRWIVPGIVDIWTARGQRLLDVGFGDSSLAGFLLPLPAHPGPEHMQWSDWLPRPRPGAPPLPDQFTYRFKAVKVGDVMRRQGVGPFEVGTGVLSLFDVAGTPQRAATTRFEIRHRGAPVAGLDSVGAVAAVAVAPPATPALLVRTGDAQGGGTCVLLREENGTATLTPLGPCSGSVRGELLTADAHAWRQANDRVIPPGWLDRTTFASVGLYRVAGGVLDTRTMAFTPIAPIDAPGEELLAYNGPPPVTLSPDESTYVWIALRGSGNEPLLAVTRWATGATTTVGIDRARMRYRDIKEIDPAWMAHHFTWVREGAALRLAERPGFTPLPYTGEREIDAKGEVTGVYLKPGGTALRDAVVDAMVREFGAEQLPDELNGYHRVVRLEGRTIKVANVTGGGFVSIGMDYGAVDSAFMRRLADRLDQYLATGALDEHFHLDPT